MVMASVQQEVPDNIREFGDRISKLTLTEFKALEDYLLEQHGLCIDFQSSKRAKEKPEWDFANWQIHFTGLQEPSRKIMVIKTVREISGLGLGEAKTLVERFGTSVVKDKLTKSEAERLCINLQHAGANATISEMS